MKRIIICYFASLGSMLGFFVAKENDRIPELLLFCLLLTACLLWFVNIMRKRKPKSCRIIHSEPVYEVTRIDIPLDDPDEDKPAGSVRPGSRPSVAYREWRAMQEQEGSA